MSTRRTATVTISVPAASCAARMMACDGYFPVPTIRRELKVRSAMTSESAESVVGCGLIRVNLNFTLRRSPPTAHRPPITGLAAADEVDDLDFVAFIDDDRVERGALENGEIELDGDAPRIDRQVSEQLGHRQRARQLVRLAIQSDPHAISVYTPRSHGRPLAGCHDAGRRPEEFERSFDSS